MMASINLVMVV